MINRKVGRKKEKKRGVQADRQKNEEKNRRFGKSEKREI